MNLLELKEASSGIFTIERNYISKEDGKKVGIKIKLNRKIKSDNSEIYYVTISNNSNKIISINSILVAEFELKKTPANILENGWTQSAQTKNRAPNESTKYPKIFLKRDANPFSFRKDFGYVNSSIVSEWYTVIDFGKNDSLLVGAITTSKQYSQTFTFNQDNKHIVRITSQLDGKKIHPNSSINSEEIIVIQGKKKEILERFSNSLLYMQKNSQKIKGLCCAYYQQGNRVNEEYVFNQLKFIDEHKSLKFNVIQIDAGYCVWGDWEENEKEFPSGFGYIVNEIKKRNMKAGIWIAPFVASPKSKLFKNNKTWFVSDKLGYPIQARFTTPLDSIFNILSLYVLDITKKEVQEYIHNTIKYFIDLGFEYLKIDFTYPLGMFNSYEGNITRAETLRLGHQIIHNAAKDKAKIQTSISQLSPLIGLVDYVRVGIDTFNPFVCHIPIINKIVNEKMIKDNLTNAIEKQFLNNKVWVNDADCTTFRNDTGITKELILKHRDFIKKYEGSIWIGDDLSKLNKKSLDDMELLLE